MQGFSTDCLVTVFFGSLASVRFIEITRVQVTAGFKAYHQKEGNILQVKCYNRCREEMKFHFLNKYLTKYHFSTTDICREF